MRNGPRCCCPPALVRLPFLIQSVAQKVHKRFFLPGSWVEVRAPLAPTEGFAQVEGGVAGEQLAWRRQQSPSYLRGEVGEPIAMSEEQYRLPGWFLDQWGRYRRCGNLFDSA